MRARQTKRPASRRRERLTREQIEPTALALIERDGIAAFSTRKLGQELSCEAMSIYHHFPSKDHLLDTLVERVVREVEVPPKGGDCIESLRKVAHDYRAMALRYPQFFQYLALHRWNNPAGLRLLDDIIGIFRRAGFSEEKAARYFRSYFYYLTGAALDETAGYAKGPSSPNPVSDAELARAYPSVAAAGPFFKNRHHEATFEVGLEMMLDGIRNALPSSHSKGGRGRGK